MKTDTAMRKKLLPIVALALGALSFASCQKDAVDNASAPSRYITRTITVSPEVEDFTPESRTAFDPNANKVILKDQETVAVGVIPSAQNVVWEVATDTQGNSPILLNQRVSDQKFEIAVSHSGTTGSFDYFFVHPAPNSPMSGTGTASIHQLPQQQMPSADGVTFDPQGDILIGKMQTIAEPESGTKGATNDMEVSFKRLFVPFKVILSDVEGLINGEQVKTVEISVPDADAPLAGAFSVSHSATAAEIAYAMSTKPDEVFRSVTADYAPQSLASNPDGTYNVWYVVNPTTLHGTITLTVNTPTRKLTCKVTPGDPVIEQGKLNSVTVKMQSSNTQITSNASDLEAVYDAGGDFYIGNVKINKTLYPNKLTLTDGDTMPEKVEGIYFLEAGTYMLPKVVTNLVVVGKSAADVTLNIFTDGASRKYTQINNSLICKNLKMVGSRNDNYNLNNGTAGALLLENFVLEGCRIELPAVAAVKSMSLATFGNVFKNIVLYKNLITFQNETADLNERESVAVINNTIIGNGEEMKNVEIVDNIFYSKKITRGSLFATNTSDKGVRTDNLSIVCARNTFIRYMAPNNPHITLMSAASVTSRNNLFWTDTDGVNNYGLRFKNAADDYTGYNPLLNFMKNGSFGLFLPVVTKDKVWEVVTAPIQAAEDKLSDDPFIGGTFDPLTMTFIPADAYKQYGARTW